MSEMKKIFGIDFGTTYSSIAYVDEVGKAIIVPNSEGDRLTPSVVQFQEDQVIVGREAKRTASLEPDKTVIAIKRSMGDPGFLFMHDSNEYKAEEISSYILRKVVTDAEQILDEKITDVVITCPAYFGINEREATKIAGDLAGLNVRHIINEPTAAAIAYGTVETDEKKVVLLYDLGGGTFDITMIEISPEAIQVICTGGDHKLGGRDWDDRIISYATEEFQKETGCSEDILEDSETLQDLVSDAEEAKRSLSQREQTGISVTYGGDRAKVLLKKSKFEELTEDLIERTISLTHEMLSEAKKKGYESFDEILLVGGSTKMPKVAKRLIQEFSNEPKLFDPDESVSKGAAIFGLKLSIDDEIIRRIKEQEAIPSGDFDIKKIDDGKKEEARKGVIEDFVLPPSIEKIVKKKILNVTSKSFGVVALDQEKKEHVCNLVLMNTSVPIDTTKTFGTMEENQETVLIRIMENTFSEERIEPETSVEIGSAVLDLPDGLPVNSPIEVTFKLNEEGRLEMSALELTDSRTVNATIETASIIQSEELEEAKTRSKKMVVT